MKTTELYLEQVLIGFLIIAIVALPWIPELLSRTEDIKTGIGIIGGSAALGFAFFIGVPFDRLADTLTGRLDRRNRLKFAIERENKKFQDQSGKDIEDPFPEDMLVIACRRDKGASETEDYHRSRVRLTRALAAYAPAMALIATFSVAHWENEGWRVEPTAAAVWFGLAAAGYLAWALLVLDDSDLPRTNDAKKMPVYRAERQKSGFDLRNLAMPSLILTVALIVGLRHYCEHKLALATALAGVLFTLLSMWSWWRISTTYRQFLADCWTHRAQATASKTS
ncbi:MAG: hypothetical protein QOF14_1548 [Hyphomicrobiales bacterium]|nr:hypothetical protein [Hyphomicrobiales bacterium]